MCDTGYFQEQMVPGHWLLETLVVFFIIFLGFCCLFPQALFLNHTLLPADLLYFYSPFRESFPHYFTTPSNWILFDELLQFAPWRSFIRTSLFNGQLPLWDDAAYCGYPMAAISQSAVFYLINLLLLPLGIAAFPTYATLLHLQIGGVGTYWFLRKSGVLPHFATAGALAFAFCGFNIAWMTHPHFYTAVWLPWMLLTVRNLVTQGNRLAIFSCVLVIHLTLMAGHIETSFHILLASFFYWLFCFVAADVPRLKTTVKSLFAALAGVSCSALSLIPFAEYLLHSAAYKVRLHETWIPTHLPPKCMLSLFIPHFFGSNAKGNYWLTQFNSNELMAGFTGVFILTAAVMGVSYIHRNREILFFSMLALFCLSLAYDVPPFPKPLLSIPLFKMSYNFRIMFVFGFCCITIAMHGLPLLLRQAKNWRWALMGLIPLLAASLLFIGLPDYPTMTKAIRKYCSVEAHIFFLCWAVAVVFLCVMRRIKAKTVIMSALCVLIFFESWLMGRNYHRSFDPALLYPGSPILNAIPQNNKEFRLLPLGFTLPPHTSLIYHFLDIRGYDALTPYNIERYLSLVDPALRSDKILPVLRMLTFHRTTHWILNSLAVRWLMLPGGTTLKQWSSGSTDESQPQLPYPLLAMRDQVTLYENPNAKKRLFLTTKVIFHKTREQAWKALQNTARNGEESYHLVLPPTNGASFTRNFSGKGNAQSPGTILQSQCNTHHIRTTVSANKPCLLVLADTYFPGWKAACNGNTVPIVRVNEALRGIILAPGSYTITFTYGPFSFKLGLFLTLFTLFLCLCLGIRTFGKYSW